MKKIGICIIVAIIVMITFMFVYDTFFYTNKPGEACLNEDLAAIEELKKQKEGIRVIMLGGSDTTNISSKASMGYFILTEHDEIIIIDGGLESDYEEIKTLVKSYSHGIIKHWILTNASAEHSGAFSKFIEDDNRFTLVNLHCNLMEESWYKKYDKKGYKEEKKLLDLIASTDKILNYYTCDDSYSYATDNIKFEVLKAPDGSENNIKDTSLVIKFTAVDVEKSILFLSDYIKDDIKELGIKLESYAVQMANHGDGGSKEVYELIKPEVAFFNSPLWFYLNQTQDGTKKLNYKTEEVRGWLDELNVDTSYIAGDCNQIIHFKEEEIELKENK